MNSDEVQIGDVTFGRKARTLTYINGQPVQLRHKSREVLRFLVENPGRTVSKAEIMDIVWADVMVSDESLVQCIADVRRVIGKHARQIVETVPREGYRLNLQAEGPSQRRAPVLVYIAVATAMLLIWVYRPIPPDAETDQISSTEIQARSTPPGTEVTEAYLEVLQGSISAGRFSRAESLVAERHFRRAIDLDPKYARAYAELGTLFAVRFENDWTVLQRADQEKALYYAEKAVALDPDLWMAHYSLGRLQSVLANLDEAEEHLERAMSLEPDNEDARAYYGIVRNFRGDAEGAISILEPATASHPNPPFWYYLGLGHALLSAGKYERASSALNRCLDLAENSPYCLRYLIAVYGMMGRIDEAKEVSGTYASMGFDPSVEAIMAPMTFYTSEDRARLEMAFRSAGLPE